MFINMQIEVLMCRVLYLVRCRVYYTVYYLMTSVCINISNYDLLVYIAVSSCLSIMQYDHITCIHGCRVNAKYNDICIINNEYSRLEYSVTWMKLRVPIIQSMCNSVYHQLILQTMLLSCIVVLIIVDITYDQC